MSIFVSVDTKAGTFRRYECGGERPRLTHHARIPVADMPRVKMDDVEGFRVHPNPEYAVDAAVRELPSPQPPQAA